MQFSSVQSLHCVELFGTPWTTAHQASLSITNCWSLPKPMAIESVMSSNHLVLCHPLLFLLSVFPTIRVFSSGQSIGSVIGLKQSEVAQSCPTLCNPMESSLSVSCIHRIFQARMLEWVAISFSRASSWPRDQTCTSFKVDRFFTTDPSGKLHSPLATGKTCFSLAAVSYSPQGHPCPY